MKSEHRHELKTNELAEWLTNLPAWAKANLRMIIYFLVILVLALGAWFWKTYQEQVVEVNQKLQLTALMNEITQNSFGVAQQQLEGADISYILLQSADRLQDYARNASEPDMAALAYIKYAQAVRAELLYRMGTADDQTVNVQIAKAKSAYEDAIKNSSDNPTHRAMATFGLGLCEEETGNFSKAREIYQQVAQDPQFAATPAANAARFRLKIMDSYKEMVTFKEPPPPAEAQFETEATPDIIMPDFNEPTPDVVNLPVEQ